VGSGHQIVGRVKRPRGGRAAPPPRAVPHHRVERRESRRVGARYRSLDPPYIVWAPNRPLCRPVMAYTGIGVCR
ncbi:MAG: hypothetical protein WEH44_03525, partial [Pirellulaceae bacterium]